MAWAREEPEPAYPEGASEDEIKKLDDELAKRANEETEETQLMAKRRGAKMYIHGSGFTKTELLAVQFSVVESGVAQAVKPVFKNSKKLGVDIPDMGAALEIGNHQLRVEVTLNGQ